MKNLYPFLAAMLLLCLAPMPYGYFMLVRYAMMIACVKVPCLSPVPFHTLRRGFHTNCGKKV